MAFFSASLRLRGESELIRRRPDRFAGERKSGNQADMEEFEDPTERVQEDLHHPAHSAGEPWVPRATLSAAVLAALAAVANLISGHHANEALIDKARSFEHWSQYQAKSIKASILASK